MDDLFIFLTELQDKNILTGTYLNSLFHSQSWYYKHRFEEWGGKQVAGGAVQRISLRKLKSGPHTKLDCFNKSVQLHMLTLFNGSTTDLYILTRVSKYTEISQADISSLKPVQIFSWDTKLIQLSQLQNITLKSKQSIASACA